MQTFFTAEWWRNNHLNANICKNYFIDSLFAELKRLRKGDGVGKVQIQIPVQEIHRGMKVELLSPGKCFQVSSESSLGRGGCGRYVPHQTSCSEGGENEVATYLDQSSRSFGERGGEMLGMGYRGSNVRTSRLSYTTV